MYARSKRPRAHRTIRRCVADDVNGRPAMLHRAIFRCAQTSDGEVWQSLRLIAAECYLSPRTVTKLIPRRQRRNRSGASDARARARNLPQLQEVQS
jgi:hypothetical protein